MNSSKYLQRAELLLFTLVAIWNLTHIITMRFLPTLDGASHLSNCNIINQLVFHHNPFFSQFFRINPEPVPNWSGHLLISLLTLVVPSFLAEKIMLAILILGIPFAFRSLMQTISPKNYLYSFLIFPFTHSMFLFFGFYNFCIAILFFLITLNFWLRNESGPWNIRKAAFFILLVTLTYFSHVVIFGLLMILILMHILITLVSALLCSPAGARDAFRMVFKRSLVAFLSAIMPFLLFVYFFYSRPGTRQISYIAREELVKYLVTVRPLISMNPIIEGKYTVYIFYLVAALAAAGVLAFLLRLALHFLRPSTDAGDRDTILLPGSRFWWLLSSIGVLLFLYFSLPDAYGTASYTSLRIAFILFLLAFLLISSFRIPWWIGLVSIVAVVWVNRALNRFYTPYIEDLGKLAVSINKAAEKTAPNSLVMPINCFDNWFTGHFTDYFSADKPVVMVYNYECEQGYFPVVWNEKTRPNYYLGSPATPDKYINFEMVKGRPSLKLDYVLVIGQYDPAKDPFFAKVHRILTEDFVKVYDENNCRLFRNRTSR